MPARTERCSGRRCGCSWRPTRKHRDGGSTRWPATRHFERISSVERPQRNVRFPLIPESAMGRALPVTRCQRRTACKSVPDPQIADSSKVVFADLTLAARSNLGYDNGTSIPTGSPNRPSRTPAAKASRASRSGLNTVHTYRPFSARRGHGSATWPLLGRPKSAAVADSAARGRRRRRGPAPHKREAFDARRPAGRHAFRAIPH